MVQPLLVQYTKLLNKNDNNPTAKPVQEFLQQHREDKVFQKRAEVLNRLCDLKRRPTSSH